MKNKCTDTGIRNAKPRDKQYRIGDGGGLYMLVMPDGAKYWRLDYSLAGKRNTMSLGVYPHISLKEARELAEHAKNNTKRGKNPKAKPNEPAQTDFEKVANDHLDLNKSSWSDTHYIRTKRLFENIWIPKFRGRKFDEIMPLEILDELMLLKNQGYGETVHKALSALSGAFDYAMIMRHASINPCRSISGLKALPVRKPSSFKAVTTPADLKSIAQKVYFHAGSIKTMTALKIQMMLFQRPVNTRTMEASELDFDAELWIIPPAKMKRELSEKVTGEPHIVPLPKQAAALLKPLVMAAKAKGESFIFGTQKGIPMSENTMNGALVSAGIPKSTQTVHGFRATARTILDEVLDFDEKLIEVNLAHTVKDSNGRSYNRTRHIEQRRQMLQKWADYIDDLIAD